MDWGGETKAYKTNWKTKDFVILCRDKEHIHSIFTL